MYSFLCFVFVQQVDMGCFCTHMLLNNPTKNKSLDGRGPEVAEATGRACEKIYVDTRKR
jgi:hypothetical protein